MRVDERLIPAVNPLGLQLIQLSAMSDALTLAFAVRRVLSRPAIFHIAEDGRTITVEGRLNLSHEEIVTRATALCTFVIPVVWKKRLPSVWCREPWRKHPLPGGLTNAEWHVLSDGSLCYELPHRWRDKIPEAEQAGGTPAAIALAQDWILNSVRWLLYRHLEAFRHNLTYWDNERWPAWGHGYEGPREYFKIKEREKRATRRREDALAA